MSAEAETRESPVVGGGDESRPRQRFVLDETGFDEVPKKYRKYYRKWKGPGDALGANDVG